MQTSNELRKERNKLSAAKSRANRRAAFERLEAMVKELTMENAQLRLENAALMVQVGCMRSVELAPLKHVSEIWSNDVGGFYDEPLTSAEVGQLMDSHNDI